MSKPKPRYLIIFSLLIVLQLLALTGNGSFQIPEETSIDKSDTAWMIVATAFVLFMTPGLSFFYGGMVSYKNVISTMLQKQQPFFTTCLHW